MSTPTLSRAPFEGSLSTKRQRQVDLSIVYVSAHSDRVTVDRAKGTDHDGFILKPFHRRDLQSTIEIAMLRRAARAKEKKQ